MEKVEEALKVIEILRSSLTKIYIYVLKCRMS